MNADGSNPINLTQNAADDIGPVWSPAPINSAILLDGNRQTEVTNNASNDPTPLSGCGSGWSQLEIGMYASVSDANEGDPNRVRSGPSQADEVITQVYAGTPLKIIDGPVCAGGLVFWKVEHQSIPGGAGWTAEGDGQDYWLEPYSP